MFLLSGCSGGAEEETPVSLLTPTETASAWIEALEQGDLAEIESLVEPTGLAVVAAVENNLRSDELAGLLGAGLTSELQAQYWNGFRDGFDVFRGESISAVTVGAETGLPGLTTFTAVELATQGATGSVILRQTESGWVVDFVATVGPALIGPLGEYLAAAVAGEHADAISGAYRDAVVPGLEAALALDPDNNALVFEAEYIRQLAASSP